MVTFNYIEEYLLWMAGITNLHGSVVHLPALAAALSASQLSFARYDVDFVYSVGEQLAKGIALTDKQFALAAKMINTYRRQMNQHGLDVPATFTAKLGIRKINQTKEVWLEGQTVKVRFPYDKVLVEQLRQIKMQGIGRVEWNPDTKTWDFAATESNVNWIVALAAVKQFHVSEDILELFGEIARTEETPYKVELVRENGAYSITNAANSLKEAIEPFANNRNMLVDYSGVAEYTNSPEILDEIMEEKGEEAGTNFIQLCITNKCVVKPKKGAFEEILIWAKETNRLPIVIYDPGYLLNSLPDSPIYQIVTKHFDKVKTKSANDLTIDPDVYYTDKVSAKHRKLLISLSAMLFGQKKEWAEEFEKVIFYSENLAV